MNTWREQAEELVKSEGFNDSTMHSQLADQLREYHEEALPKLEGFAADLMNAALSEVNWEEIAHSLLEDAKEALEA